MALVAAAPAVAQSLTLPINNPQLPTLFIAGDSTLIADEYDSMGPAKVESLFADPHTHTSRAGAELNARAVIDGLKKLNPDPLAKYLLASSAQIQ